MSDETVTPSARMSAAFAKLRDSAHEIKTHSDALSREVRAIERALNAFDLRVASHTVISEWVAWDQDEFKRDYVAYLEVHQEWRIVIQHETGWNHDPENTHETTWLFDKAPQYMRIKAVDKLPELIEGLVATVDKTTERLKKKVEPTKELANVVTTAIAKKKVAG